MSYWGLGPFDNDSALDYLGDLAHEHAVVDRDGGISPGSVDHDGVTRALRGTLENGAAFAEAYAAAGLVAAVRAGVSSHSRGTRLFAASEALAEGRRLELPGLSAHCGFVALLRASDAEALASAARQWLANYALRVDPEWAEALRALQGELP